DHDIAGSDDAGAAAEAAALHQGDRGCPQLVQASHGRAGVARGLLVLGLRLRRDAADPLQVGAGLEMPSVAAQDHGPQVPVGLERIEAGQQAADQRLVVGVVHFGAVERDGGDAAGVDVAEDGIGHDPYSWSSSNALCSTRTASSMYFSSTTTVILISEVEIIWMLMPSSASVRNICAAMPACERMPMPTTDTLAIRSSPLTSLQPMCGWTCSRRILTAFG